MLRKLSLPVFLVLLMACASKKNKESTTTMEKQKVVISFISKGSGTNSALFTKTKELLDNSKCESSYQVKPWGREGEKDICLEASAKCYPELLKEIKTLIGSDERVQIKENGECRK